MNAAAALKMTTDSVDICRRTLLCRIYELVEGRAVYSFTSAQIGTVLNPYPDNVQELVLELLRKQGYTILGKPGATLITISWNQPK